MIAIHETLPATLQDLVQLVDDMVRRRVVRNHYYALRSLRMQYLIRRVDPGCDIVNWARFYKTYTMARGKFRRTAKATHLTPLAFIAFRTEYNDLGSIQRLNGV